MRVVCAPRRLSGDAAEAGKRLARRARTLAPGTVLLAGGETTVALGDVDGEAGGAGRGGRTLELALAAAQAAAGERGFHILASGSDGRDGSSGAAGAFADGSTWIRAQRRGLDPDGALARHATRGVFAALGGLHVTGPTGTNVGDWVFLLRR